MIELEAHERLVLDATRRVLSPAPTDRARVRAGITAAISAGHEPEIPDAAPGDVIAGSSWLPKILSGVGIAAAFGGAGYFAGYHAGVEARSPERVEHAPAQVASPAVLTAPPASLPAPTATTRPSDDSVAPLPRGIASVRPAASAPNADGLDEEIRTLRRVERAQRSGNPQLALALLEELDQKVPSGKLTEERAAARAAAACQSSFGESRSKLLEAFRKMYPGSVYLSRVENACAETDRTASGDSMSEREPAR